MIATKPQHRTLGEDDLSSAGYQSGALVWTEVWWWSEEMEWRRGNGVTEVRRRSSGLDEGGAVAGRPGMERGGGDWWLALWWCGGRPRLIWMKDGRISPRRESAGDGGRDLGSEARSAMGSRRKWRGARMEVDLGSGRGLDGDERSSSSMTKEEVLVVMGIQGGVSWRWLCCGGWIRWSRSALDLGGRQDGGSAREEGGRSGEKVKERKRDGASRWSAMAEKIGSGVEAVKFCC